MSPYIKAAVARMDLPVSVAFGGSSFWVTRPFGNRGSRQIDRYDTASDAAAAYLQLCETFASASPSTADMPDCSVSSPPGVR